MEINFFVPEGSMRELPVFKGKERVGLIQGLHEIVDKSSEIQLNILKAFLK